MTRLLTHQINPLRPSMTKAMPWFVGYLIMEVAAMKNDTLKKLKSMRLPTFAEDYEKQIDQEAEYGSMSFHERLMLLVDAEYDSRHNNNIKRLVKNARFSDSSAFLGNIDYLPDRHLNRDLLESLVDNDYIRQGLNVILILQIPIKRGTCSAPTVRSVQFKRCGAPSL